MKRYWAFAYHEFDAFGGMGDFVAASDSDTELALDLDKENLRMHYDIAHIFDTRDAKVVFLGARNGSAGFHWRLPEGGEYDPSYYASILENEPNR